MDANDKLVAAVIDAVARAEATSQRQQESPEVFHAYCLELGLGPTDVVSRGLLGGHAAFFTPCAILCALTETGIA
jgi:hypothetical protein